MESSKITITQKITSVSLNKPTASVPEVITVTDVQLPTDAPARVKTIKSEGRKWYLTVTYLPDTERPFALFCHTNHAEKTILTDNAVELLESLARSKGILEDHIVTNSEKCRNEPNVSRITRTISLLLRHGVAIRNIVSTLDSVQGITVTSFLFHLKKFLSSYILDGELVDSEACSACGGTLVFSEGCMSCRDCGHSKCS